MTTITRERLEQIIASPASAGSSDVIRELARIALASLEADPVLYAAEETLAYAKHGELHLTCLSEPMGDAVIPLCAAHPAQRTPDMTDFRPCPFCNSPVKWCGENSADPEDDHACHHIQCTNPECGADFDFTNTGDDLLPDDPETLDAMTAAECLQPLRNVCLNRFNSRAALLQGSQPVTTTNKLPEETDSSLQLRNLIRQRHAEWSQATFGDVGPVGPLKHLSKEALEAAEEPDDLSEWADMQFLLWDAQRRMGLSDEFITRAMIEKLEINKARQWPEPKDGEPRLHIKEQSESVLPEIECDICGHVSTDPEGRHHCCEDNSND